jgi:hypothetical protein
MKQVQIYYYYIYYTPIYFISLRVEFDILIDYYLIFLSNNLFKIYPKNLNYYLHYFSYTCY